MRRSRLGWLAVLFAVLFAVFLAVGACEVTYDPEVGPLVLAGSDGGGAGVDGGGGGGDGGSSIAPCTDSDPAVSVSLALDVRPLMYRSPGGCSCHTSSTTSGFNLATYEHLRHGGLNSGERVIVPGLPCDSILVQKLGPTPPFGSRMPFNGPPYFTADELALVKDWIAEGALDN
jgi:hypothetical protein